MDVRELGRLDLNLLVALEALLEERSVSRAAERLYITQSAMSKTLGRLRDLFGDPLFTRKASGMVPTPRAEQLSRHLPEVLLAVQAMLRPEQFDPLTCDGEFNLLVPSHIAPWAMPLLVERLVEKAPNIRVKVISSHEDQLDLLASGRLDFAIQVERQHYPPGLDVATIGFAPSLLLARAGHPLQGRELTWDMVLAYPQVQLIIPELQEIIFLADPDSGFMTHERQVVAHLETDNLFTAARVVRHSDYIFPAPPLFMEQEELSKDIIALPLPGGEEVTLKFVLVSHERIASSAAHGFIRQELVAAIEQFRARYGLPPLDEMRRLRGLQF